MPTRPESGGAAAGAADHAADPLDAVPCGLLSFADDGAVLAVNRGLLELLGYEREELLGRHVERILTVSGRIFFQTHFFPLLALHGRAQEIFLVLRRRDGTDVGALVSAERRERDGAHVTDCALLAVRERRKYEDALLRAKREAEEAQRALEARTRELEEAYAQLQARAAELERQQDVLEQQAAELESSSEELRMLNDELSLRTDEVERERRAADAANRAKSEFLAVMSHELRTPLNAIGGYAELLEMGIHGPVTAEQHEALGRLVRSQRHLLRLVNDVLNLARVESGHVDYIVEDVPLADLVAGVEPMIAPQAAAKSIELVARVPDDLVARVDREKLQQILLNLLGNAVKFTPEGGRVTIDGGIGAEQGVVRLTVADNGRGIPAQKLEAIFQPFVQVDASHTRTTEGSGLGLSISRNLARGMGGDLEVHSDVGGGSAFTVVLPRALPAELPAPAPAAGAS